MRDFARFLQARGKGCCESASDASGGVSEDLRLPGPARNKVEHTNAIANLTDEELDAMIEELREATLPAVRSARVTASN